MTDFRETTPQELTDFLMEAIPDAFGNCQSAILEQGFTMDDLAWMLISIERKLEVSEMPPWDNDRDNSDRMAYSAELVHWIKVIQALLAIMQTKPLP